jgi:hypothetical protein
MSKHNLHKESDDWAHANTPTEEGRRFAGGGPGTHLYPPDMSNTLRQLIMKRIMLYPTHTNMITLYAVLNPSRTKSGHIQGTEER